MSNAFEGMNMIGLQNSCNQLSFAVKYGVLGCYIRDPTSPGTCGENIKKIGVENKRFFSGFEITHLIAVPT